MMNELTVKDLETVARVFGFLSNPQALFDIAEGAEYRLNAMERVA